ncbi:MAG: AbrB/MazE/SpoVT family DNA-binding domain-containing protein [Promethearchaeota archaeon]|nr:MAG: AbrB/MazE/SpoVT family DNA-binding domain-containing protein [Candidatus Lokiarchaeota archaeon]
MHFLLLGMNVGKMSKKGQIVIPKEIRDRFGIKPGDAVIFKIQGDKVIIEKIQEKMSDILKNSKPVENSLEFQKKLRDEWE